MTDVAATTGTSRKRVLNLEPVPRITLTPTEAAAALGVGRAFFDGHIAPELRVIRRGKLVLIPIADLERWVKQEAALTLQAKR